MPRVHAPRLLQEKGFTLIDILFVVALIGVIASMAVPGLMRARAQAGAAAAIGNLRVINSGQISYAITCGSGFYAPDLTTLGTVPPGGNNAFVPPDLGAANTVIRTQYQIQMSATPVPGSPGGCNGVAPGQQGTGYRLGADALDPTLTRFFATNASGVIFEADVSLYAVMPESGSPAIGVAIH